MFQQGSYLSCIRAQRPIIYDIIDAYNEQSLSMLFTLRAKYSFLLLIFTLSCFLVVNEGCFFKGDVHLLHNKQENDQQFHGNEG